MESSKKTELASKVIQLIFVAFLAKGLGFIREMVLANYYGATMISDVYVAVHNIPAIIFTVFGIAVTTGFIPLYTELKIKEGQNRADCFANNIFNIFLVLAVVLTLIGIMFSEQLVTVFAGGFTGETFKLCNEFAKIIMPTSIAIILVYVYNAYLQINGIFNQNSLMNVPYNMFQILFIIIAFYVENYYFLAIGIFLSSFSQLIYLKKLVKKRTIFKHQMIFDFKDQKLFQMLILVGPVFISTGINQINSIVDRALASRLIEGSVSALNYSVEVANIVTQVIILSLTTIMYPKMTELFANSDTDKKNMFIQTYISVVSILVLPLASLIFIFSEEIISILFGRGAFTKETVIFVSRALRLYAIGIIGASFRDVLNKVFYALKNTITPMVNGTISVIFNIILNFILVNKYKYLGLAFATSFASTVCTVLMFYQLIKKMPGINSKIIFLEFFKSVIAMVIMSVAIILLNNAFPIYLGLLRCIIYGSVGIILYLITLILLKEVLILEIVYNIYQKKITNILK